MLSSHPFPFGNRHAWVTKHLSLESRQRSRQPFRQRYAAVQAAHTAVPGEEAVQTCPSIPSLVWIRDTCLSCNHNHLNHLESLHTISCHFNPFHTYEQHGTAACKHLMLHGSWKQATDLHCFLQSNCRLQKNSANSAWRTHFRAYYALSKDAASSPSEKKMNLTMKLTSCALCPELAPLPCALGQLHPEPGLWP